MARATILIAFFSFVRHCEESCARRGNLSQTMVDPHVAIAPRDDETEERLFRLLKSLTSPSHTPYIIKYKYKYN